MFLPLWPMLHFGSWLSSAKKMNKSSYPSFHTNLFSKLLLEEESPIISIFFFLICDFITGQSKHPSVKLNKPLVFLIMQFSINPRQTLLLFFFGVGFGLIKVFLLPIFHTKYIFKALWWNLSYL